MKLALLLPGYLDSPDYFHLITFEKRLKELGYTIERLDACNLWQTGDVDNYSITNFLQQIKDRIDFYKNQNPEEILLLGHSNGAFTAIIAGSKFSEVTRIIALCSPPDKTGSEIKWKNGFRVSKRDLPINPSEFREFAIPVSYLKDALQYSAVEEVKNIYKPLMIFIGLNDQVVPPSETEEIVNAANNPYVVKLKGIGHDFRNSEEQTNLVTDEIVKFLKLQNNP
jgi:pimeloyl-ACP methyl ester carboxylesterase